MDNPPLQKVTWPRAHRIIRSRCPPIDLFEDIADPADWDAIMSAEAKTNPRVAESVGMLDLVPVERRVAGDGATWVMAPFVHVSPDRASRFSDGTYGVYYAGDSVEVALFETLHHHAQFMASTDEPAGWTLDFREVVGSIDEQFHDISSSEEFTEHHNPDDYSASQALASQLRGDGSNGIQYNSARFPGGKCIAAFWPDVIGLPVQAEHFSYFWDGTNVSKIKNLTSGDVFSVMD